MNLEAPIKLLSAPVQAQQQYVSVLTGGTSGVYYPLGVALTQIYGKSLQNTRSSVQATKASAENLNLLQSGRGEIAFTLGDALSDAWKGNSLVLLEARIRGQGAGMEVPEGAHLKNGVWYYQPEMREHASLQLTRSSYAKDYELCWDGACKSMGEIVGSPDAADLVVVTSCKSLR